MDNQQGPNLKTIFGIIGCVIGIPLSYFFQPGLVRAKMNLGDYIKALPELYANLGNNPSEIVIPAIFTPVILAALGVFIGHLIMKGQNPPDSQRSTISENSNRGSYSSHAAGSYSTSINGVDGEISAVIEGYTLKIKNEPLNTDLLYELAEFLTKNGDQKKSIQTLLKLTTLEKNNKNAYKLLMSNYHSCERYDELINTGMNLLELDPLDKEVMLQLSNALSSQKKYNESLIYINKMLEIDNHDKNTWLIRSDISEKLMNYEQVIDSLLHVVKIDPSDLESRLKLVEHLSVQNDYNSILSISKNIVITDKSIDKALHLYVAWSLIKCEKTHNEIDAILKNIDINDIEIADIKNKTVKSDLISFLANSCFSKKEYEKALELYINANSYHSSEMINNKIGNSYNEIGKKYLFNKKYNEAYKYFREGSNYDKENADIKSNLLLATNKLKYRKKTIVVTCTLVAICLLGISSIYYYGRQAFDIQVEVPGKIKVINGEQIVATGNGVSLKTDLLFLGSYKIIVEKEGFETKEIFEKIGFGRNFKKLEYVLEPIYGSVKIDSEPSGAKITIKNSYQKYEGITPHTFLNVFAIENNINIELNNYNIYENTFVLNKNEKKDFGKILFVGDIKIDTEVKGADVYIDGNKVGKTPISINSLPAKKVKVLVTKKGYGSFLKYVDLLPSQAVDLGKVELSNLATLAINSDPEGAEVWLSTKNSGMTPIGMTPVVTNKILPGDYYLRVANQNTSHIEPIILQKGEFLEKNINFYSSLKVNTVPKGLGVLIDDVHVGKTPFQSDRVLSGARNIKLIYNNNVFFDVNYGINKDKELDIGTIETEPFKKGQLWKGSYECSQGNTNLLLTIVDVKNEKVKAIFDFNYSQGKATGQFFLDGIYMLKNNRSIIFKPEQWINNPNNYQSVGMEGNFYTSSDEFGGTITDPGCKIFSLKRSSETIDPDTYLNNLRK